MSKKFLVSAVAAVSFGLVAMSGGSALAAGKSICKGLVKAQCGANTSCSWVKSYKTKAGKKVAAHCRSKPKPAAKPKAN